MKVPRMPAMRQPPRYREPRPSRTIDRATNDILDITKMGAVSSIGIGVMGVAGSLIKK